MSVLINDFGDCQTDVKGTGTTVCDFLSFGDLLGIGVLAKGTTFAITSGSVALTEAVFDGLIQDRTLHQLINRLNFTQDTPDNEIYTDPTGLESSIRDGKPKQTLMFARGGEFHKALHSLKGDNRWDIFQYFSNGILLTTNQAGTLAKGFDAGRFDVSTLKYLAGTDPQQGSCMIQFTRPDEFNKTHLFITWEALGFDASLVDGVVDCVVTVVTPPTNTDTTMTVRLTSASNTGNVLLGFDDILNWATGGVQTTPKAAPTAVAYNSTTGNYDMTFATAFITGDTYQPRLRDLTQNVAVDANGKFYAGRSEIGTVLV